jgi:HEAT repeat protein
MEAVSSVPKLKTALNDKEPAAVLAAAHALCLLGEQREAFSIDYALVTGERKTRDGFVKSQINSAKSEMNAVRDDPKAAVLRTGIGFVPVPGARELYGALKEIRKNDAISIRAAAAEELAEDRDPEVDAALARACSDKEWTIRAAAVSAIAKRDNPALLSAITPALEDKNDVVRYEAAAALLRLYADIEKDGRSEFQL